MPTPIHTAPFAFAGIQSPGCSSELRTSLEDAKQKLEWLRTRRRSLISPVTLYLCRRGQLPSRSSHYHASFISVFDALPYRAGITQWLECLLHSFLGVFLVMSLVKLRPNAQDVVGSKPTTRILSLPPHFCLSTKGDAANALAAMQSLDVA